MCYTIPGKLVEIKGNTGIIDYFGEKRRVLVDFVNVKVGDYVYAQGGIVINKLSEAQAREILDAWEELFFALKEKDKKLSTFNKNISSQHLLWDILQKINRNQPLSRDEMLCILDIRRDDERIVYDLANNIRQREHGNACCVHGIIEFSNICESNCWYCGIRRDADIERYRMGIDEIIEVANKAVDKWGFKALVLQSGEDLWYDGDKLEYIVKIIRSKGVLVFLSIGERDKELYKRLYDAGARAVLLRFETSDKNKFSCYRPGRELRTRIDLIKYLKQLGYILATGFLIGLPQESKDVLINNIMLTKELAPQMYSFGPFIPTIGTPLAGKQLLTKSDILKAIALTRFVDKNANILVTTAMETLDQDILKDALMAGANSLMINVTPLQYKRLYRIYANRTGVEDDIEKQIRRILDVLYSLGRAPTDLGL